MRDHEHPGKQQRGSADRLKAPLEQIRAKTANVAIIGLGYVGLPLSLTAAEAGYPVLGFDLDETKIKTLNQGESYFAHIAPKRVAGVRVRSTRRTRG